MYSYFLSYLYLEAELELIVFWRPGLLPCLQLQRGQEHILKPRSWRRLGRWRISCSCSCLFRIRIQLGTFRVPDTDPTHVIFGNYKNTLKSIKKKNLPTICHFLSYTIVLQYRLFRPKNLKILIYLLLHSCWIRIRNYLFRIQEKVQDPQHWSNQLRRFQYLPPPLGICLNTGTRKKNPDSLKN